MAEWLPVAPELEDRKRAARWACASSSEAGADELRPRLSFFRASFRATEDCGFDTGGCALVLGRPSAEGGIAPSSKHTVHEEGRPSVTIRGVGP